MFRRNDLVHSFAAVSLMAAALLKDYDKSVYLSEFNNIHFS